MHVPWSNLVNSFGLLLDIAGVVLIWRYALSPAIDREGHSHLVEEGVNEGEKALAKHYVVLSRVGLGLVIIGFVVQLVSNFISI